MIEFPTITDSKRFTYNNEAKRKGENRETEFSEFLRNQGVGESETVSSTTVNEEYDYETGLVNELDLVTYTNFGKLSLNGNFKGRNINFEI